MKLSPRVANWALMAVLGGACAFFGLVYSVKVTFGAALAFFVISLVFDLWSLQVSILPIFFAIAMDRLGQIGETPLTVAKVFITVFMIAWAVRVVLERDPEPLDAVLQSPIFYLAALLLSLSFVSIVNAHDIPMFFGQTLRRVNNFVLFILILTVVDSARVIRWIFLVLMLAYLLVGMMCVYELYTEKSILETLRGEENTALDYTLTSDTFRIGGPGGDPDFLAISVIFPSLIALRLLFDRGSILLKIPVATVFMLLVFCILATGSRGGLLAWLVAAGIFWLLTEMRWKYTTAAVAGILITCMLVVLSVSSSSGASARFTGETGGTSIKYRLGWWKMAAMMIADHPFAGVGTGNFPDTYNRYSWRVPQVPRSPFWTHNSILQTWAENGVLAFLVYVSIYVLAASMMISVLRRTRDGTIRRLAVLLLATIAGYFCFAGTSNILENENYWIVFALTSVVYRLSFSSEAVPEEQRVVNPAI